MWKKNYKSMGYTFTRKECLGDEKSTGRTQCILVHEDYELPYIFRCYRLSEITREKIDNFLYKGFERRFNLPIIASKEDRLTIRERYIRLNRHLDEIEENEDEGFKNLYNDNSRIISPYEKEYWDLIDAADVHDV